MSENSSCPGGCGYTKEGDTDSEVWCFVEGPYTPTYSCPSAATSTTGGTAGSTTGGASTTAESTTTGISTETSSTNGGSTSTGICAPGSHHFGGSCYKLVTPAVAWAEARHLCECSGGGSLATVTSAEETAFLQTLLGAEDAWIGLNDLAAQGSFVWADGAGLGSYSNWDADKGNLNYNDRIWHLDFLTSSPNINKCFMIIYLSS